MVEMSKLATKNLKVIAMVLIIMLLLFLSLWYLFIGKNDLRGKIEFSISIEKTVFSVDESINVTFRVLNNQNETTEVSEFWLCGTLFLQLWDSSGNDIPVLSYSEPGGQIEGVTLQSSNVYEETFDIAPHFGPDLVPDTYTFNASYVNFHPYEGNINWSNGTTYHSNTIEFHIEGSLAFVSFQLPGECLNITCEIASTPEERTVGLMHREELPMDRGMLFVFDTPREMSFWMKNTLIPLDMVFIEENGNVTNVEEADVEIDVPDNELTRYCSDGPVKWVVEINQGICATYGIGSGTPVLIQYL